MNNDTTKIFLAGYCQGADLCLHIGLRYNKRLGGIISLNGKLFSITEGKDVHKDTPIVLFHSVNDDTVPWEKVKVSYERITKFPNVTINTYKNKTHAILDEEIADLCKWIKTTTTHW